MERRRFFLSTTLCPVGEFRFYPLLLNKLRSVSSNFQIESILKFQQLLLQIAKWLLVYSPDPLARFALALFLSLPYLFAECLGFHFRFCRTRNHCIIPVLLLVCWQVYAGQSILPSEYAIPTRSFAKAAGSAPPPRPASMGDGESESFCASSQGVDFFIHFPFWDQLECLVLLMMTINMSRHLGRVLFVEKRAK